MLDYTYGGCAQQKEYATWNDWSLNRHCRHSHRFHSTSAVDADSKLQIQCRHLRFVQDVLIYADAPELRHRLRSSSVRLLYLELVLCGRYGHRTIARPCGTCGLRHESVCDEPIRDGGAPGPHHPGREPPSSVVLRVLSHGASRQLYRFDPVDDVRFFAADPVHHDVVFRLDADRVRRDGACRWTHPHLRLRAHHPADAGSVHRNREHPVVHLRVEQLHVRARPIRIEHEDVACRDL